MNYSIRQMQGQGKTLSMVALIKNFLNPRKYTYIPHEVIANFQLNIEGVHVVNNDTMRKYLYKMITEGLRHKIVAITEIDRLFPARFWQDKNQTSAILGLWQDEKLFSRIIWDAHIGSSVDLLLRQTSQYEILPQMDKYNDRLYITVLNLLNFTKTRWYVDNVSKRLFPLYDRWELIGLKTKEDNGNNYQVAA